jgi:hypothetical protein
VGGALRVDGLSDVEGRPVVPLRRGALCFLVVLAPSADQDAWTLNDRSREVRDEGLEAGR